MHESVLFHPAYFGSVLQFAVLSQNNNWVLEEQDNYQKQTYRNRQYIYGANGKLLLNIPVKHGKSKRGHQKYKEVEIENQFPWQDNHWKSLQTAYRTSPFFEFYEDDFVPLYKKQFKYLFDFNLNCMEVVCECLELPFSYKTTENYQLPGETATTVKDYRKLANAKKEFNFSQDEYNQVFEEKHGFLKNLSVVDLLFNKGPETLTYLEQQDLSGLQL